MKICINCGQETVIDTDKDMPKPKKSLWQKIKSLRYYYDEKRKSKQGLDKGC
jgi:hypothetical protein